MMGSLHSSSARGTLRHHEKRQVAASAQMIEAIAMLLVVICALGVATVLLASATGRVRASATEEAATRAAVNAAEAFSADPASVPAVQEAGELTVACDATSEPRSAGTLWRAHITVTDADGAAVYELETARYVASTAGHEGGGA